MDVGALVNAQFSAVFRVVWQYVGRCQLLWTLGDYVVVGLGGQLAFALHAHLEVGCLGWLGAVRLQYRALTRLFLDFKQALANSGIKSIPFEADYLSLADIVSFRRHIASTELAHWSHRRLRQVLAQHHLHHLCLMSPISRHVLDHVVWKKLRV